MKSNKLSIFILFLCITSQLVTAATLNDDTKIITTAEPSSTETTSTTTTTAKSTTTESTTMTPSSTTTVAPSPTTTVAPSPTTTVKPTPVPAPEIGLWSYLDTKTNQTCTIVQMALQFNLTYKDTDNKPLTALYNLPINNTKVVSGSCSNDTNIIVLNWIEPSNKLTLNFKLNTTKSEYTLDSFEFNLNISNDMSDFPNGKVNQTLNLLHNGDVFETPMDMSYHCTKEQTINLTSTTSNAIEGIAFLSHLQFEAFHKSSNQQFSTAKDCDSIDTPDIVPIAVGCALAGLVIIVLIAYLVGRRRAQARGYLSM